jgi:hypothetical protein
MDVQLRAITSVSVLLMLILGLMMFKRFGLLAEEHGRLCSALITKVTLPALICVTLIHAEFSWEYPKMTALLMGASVVGLGLGWLVSRAFHLDGPSTAPVVLACGFSSSTVLGVSLIGELFPGREAEVAETIVLSSLGMIPFVITGGTMIAMYYGASEMTPRERRRATLAYFRSPIFVSILAGVALAFLADHEGSVAHSFLDGLRLVSAGNTLMVLLTVGLLVEVQDLRGIVGLASCVAVVNLLVLPLLVLGPAHAMDLPHWTIEVLTLEAAMPAVMLPVVLCHEYGANGRLGAKLVLATITASVFTIPLVFQIGSWL